MFHNDDERTRSIPQYDDDHDLQQDLPPGALANQKQWRRPSPSPPPPPPPAKPQTFVVVGNSTSVCGSPSVVSGVTLDRAMDDLATEDEGMDSCGIQEPSSSVMDNMVGGHLHGDVENDVDMKRYHVLMERYLSLQAQDLADDEDFFRVRTEHHDEVKHEEAEEDQTNDMGPLQQYPVNGLSGVIVTNDDDDCESAPMEKSVLAPRENRAEATNDQEMQTNNQNCNITNGHDCSADSNDVNKRTGRSTNVMANRGRAGSVSSLSNRQKPVATRSQIIPIAEQYSSEPQQDGVDVENQSNYVMVSVGDEERKSKRELCRLRILSILCFTAGVAATFLVLFSLNRMGQGIFGYEVEFQSTSSSRGETITAVENPPTNPTAGSMTISPTRSPVRNEVSFRSFLMYPKVVLLL